MSTSTPETVPAKALVAFLVFASLIHPASNASAQSLSNQLSALLTQQQSSGGVPPDPAAAATTRDTISSLFAVELATVPTSSSAGGFVYELNRSLGLIERASDGFGPFFTERVLRNNGGQASFGLSYQFATFSSLQGANLEDGTFPTNASRLQAAAQPFSVDTLELELESSTTTVFMSYGATDRLAIGAWLPITTVRLNGRRTRTTNATSSLQSVQAGSATGLGDVALTARYIVGGTVVRGASIGGDLRLPTGREEDFLGAGKASARVLGIGSWEEGPYALHANGGFGVGGVSRELFWGAATTIAPSQRVTIVGEFLGRWLAQLSHVSDVYQPHSLVNGVQTMRWVSADPGVHTLFVATGAKWNVGSSWLLNTSLLIRLTDTGLRARFTPAVSVDYSFES